MPLLKLIDSKNGSLQHNAAFALYGLADNEVNSLLFHCLLNCSLLTCKLLVPLYY